jgi:hypothetical protein
MCFIAIIPIREFRAGLKKAQPQKITVVPLAYRPLALPKESADLDLGASPSIKVLKTKLGASPFLIITRSVAQQMHNSIRLGFYLILPYPNPRPFFIQSDSPARTLSRKIPKNSTLSVT